VKGGVVLGAPGETRKGLLVPHAAEDQNNNKRKRGRFLKRLGECFRHYRANRKEGDDAGYSNWSTAYWGLAGQSTGGEEISVKG